MNDAAEYRELFIAEAQENLRALSDGALRLERPDGGSAAVDGLFRAAHTIKGMAATMGFEGLTRLCHGLEDALDAVRSGERPADPALSDALLAAVDEMTVMLADVAAGGDGGLPGAGVLERFRTQPQALALIPAASASSDTPRPVFEALHRGRPVLKLSVDLDPSCAFKGVRALLVRRALESVAEVLATRPGGPALEDGDFTGPFDVWTSAGDPAAQERVVRGILEVADVHLEVLAVPLGVEVPSQDKTEPLALSLVEAPTARTLDTDAAAPKSAPWAARDAHLDSVEDEAPRTALPPQTLRVSAGRLDKVLNLVGELVTARIRLAQFAQGRENKELGEALLQVEHIVNELQQEVTAARLVPVDQIFSRFPRLIRDLGREMGKPMELLIEGREIELDRGVLDELDETLVHLLRNAADHGIESPERRAQAGKPIMGTVRLGARRDRNHVVVTVEDDGAGLDVERIRQVAVDKGLLDAATARSLGDEDVLAFIFSPGFSTSGAVTLVSGRGVGMDAARVRIEALGGSLKVESTAGKGARFRVRVPLTLAIIRALRVRAGQEHYMAPVANVVEAVECSRDEIITHEGAPAMLLRGEPLPLRRLDELLGAAGSAWPPLFTVLVAESGDAHAGLAVDEVLGQQEIAIKSLGRSLKSVRGFGGVTILGDGSVRLILDLPSLLGL